MLAEETAPGQENTNHVSATEQTPNVSDLTDQTDEPRVQQETELSQNSSACESGVSERFSAGSLLSGTVDDEDGTASGTTGVQQFETDREIRVDGKQVLEELECPVCINYMSPPIFLCSSGHSICHECKKQLQSCPICRRPFLSARNIALEKIAREITGLKVAGEVEREELPSAGCVFTDCDWKGYVLEVKSHLKESHADQVMYESHQIGGLKKYWDLPVKVSDKRVIFAFQQTFCYRLKLNTIKKLFLVAVQCFAPSDLALRFRYEVQLLAGVEKFVNGRVVLDESKDVDAAVLTETDCISVDYSIVKAFSSKSNFRYCIRICKSE